MSGRPLAQVYGVRHLSPAGAVHLRRFLDEVDPEVVLIEGPSDATDQLKHLVGALRRQTGRRADDPQVVTPGAALVRRGRLQNRADRPDRVGEVVPRGVEHCPRADEETHVLLIERSGTVNTGDAAPGALTAPEQAL